MEDAPAPPAIVERLMLELVVLTVMLMPEFGSLGLPGTTPPRLTCTGACRPLPTLTFGRLAVGCGTLMNSELAGMQLDGQPIIGVVVKPPPGLLAETVVLIGAATGLKVAF